MRLFYITLCFVIVSCKTSIVATDTKPVDLLEVYGEKPEHLEFTGNDEPGVQRIIVSKYKVESKYAKEVEDFLKEKYDLPPLRFICCNYHHQGYGGIDSDIIKEKYGEYADIIIHMYSDELDLSMPFNTKNEYERAEYFYVTVEIVVV